MRGWPAPPVAVKATRPTARSPPLWIMNRTPQARKMSGIVQAPLPIRMISVEDTAAPNRPNMFCAGSSVATIQPGSSGE